MNTYNHAYVQTYMRTGDTLPVDVCVCVYTYKYIHIYILTHIYIYNFHPSKELLLEAMPGPDFAGLSVESWICSASWHLATRILPTASQSEERTLLASTGLHFGPAAESDFGSPH